MSLASLVFVFRLLGSPQATLDGTAHFSGMDNCFLIYQVVHALGSVYVCLPSQHDATIQPDFRAGHTTDAEYAGSRHCGIDVDDKSPGLTI